jgi:hypothetical protein
MEPLVHIVFPGTNILGQLTDISRVPPKLKTDLTGKYQKPSSNVSDPDADVIKSKKC